MLEQVLYAKNESGISDAELKAALESSIADCRKDLKKILLIPPDFTRFPSQAGKITNILYHMLKDECQIDILPALGTHVAMTEDECEEMFGDIPFEKFIVHNWRTDVVKIGEVPAEFVYEVSEHVVNESIDVEVNHLIVDGGYDLILSIGQVVPHEVVGMANYSKNIFVGCGGNRMINASHMLGAFYGLERLMGKDHSPVRKVFDYAQDNFLKDLPLHYIFTVIDGGPIAGLFISGGRKNFEKAIELSQERNLNFVEPIKKVVVNMDEREFKTTWVANKSVYRTRMAIADDGDLIVLAPGVHTFGEDKDIDFLIRKYGYTGREHIIQMANENEDLHGNLSAAAHLIHGSSDGRFRITYCTKLLTEDEVRGVGFNYIPYDEAVKMYDPATLKDGYNTLPNGEEIYFISNPALGLWADKTKF